MQKTMAKQLDLLIVNPMIKKVYQKAQEEADYPAHEPPYLGILTADFVRRRGFEVQVLDASLEGLSPEDTSDGIRYFNPRLVHVMVHGNQPNASTQLMDKVNELCNIVKDSSLESKVLVTGVHPSALPERTLIESRADYVGKGDPFYVVLGLLEENNLSDVPGLWYRNNGEINQGLHARLLDKDEMKDELPTAAWDLLNVSKYRSHDWHSLENLSARQPYAAIYTSFGCGLGCNFCPINAPFIDENGNVIGIRFRDPDSVVNEIEMLVNNYGIRNLKIIDEMFVFDQRHYTSIAKKLIEKNLGERLNMWAYARVDTVKEGNLELLKKAGFNWLALGIESGSAHVRAGAHKKFDEEDIFKIVKKIQNRGINVVGNYIFGLPDDTLETMQATLDLSKSLNTERPNYYSAVAYPGSGLHSYAQNTKELLREHGVKRAYEIISSQMEEHRKDPKKTPMRYLPIPLDWDPNMPLLPEDEGGPGWIGYSQHSYDTLPLPTQYLRPEQVLAFRDNALKAYFKDPSYIQFLKDKFGQEDAIERFCEVNSSTPKRKILGH